ncbi:MAG: 50S ribosomal protein L35 [bacterium]
MPKLKTRKAARKRFMVTGAKKLRKRKCGQDHFNSRESGNITRKKRRDTGIAKGHEKNIREMMPYI